MIPLARPLISEEEKQKVLRVLESGRLAAGPCVDEFEEAFAAYQGGGEAVMTSSGTSALLAAVVALGIRPGDKVFVTPFTFIATVNALIYARAVPVFVDINPVTFNLDPHRLEEAMDEHPDAVAVMVVHLYGLPADMGRISTLARTRGMLLIEDCCQAPGAAVGGRKVGNFGDASVFSFYATKNMTTGEGGALVTADRSVAARARAFIDHGQRARYRHESLGFNMRMGEIQAAIGLCQLRRLDGWNEARRSNARFYNDNIMSPAVRRPAAPPGFRHVYHHYTLRAERRDALIRHFQSRGVSCGVHYPLPVPDQPLYRGLTAMGSDCAVAREAARQVVSIPVHPALTEEELYRVAEAVNGFGG